MWWVIACGRAYKITGDERYLKKSKAMFDFVYDNFTDAKMGGGVYWINQRTSKNSCVNSPTVIAAVRLSEFLKDRLLPGQGQESLCLAEENPDRRKRQGLRQYLLRSNAANPSRSPSSR